MEIVVGRPPNYAAIAAVFPQAARHTVVFCYGDTIFSPQGKNLPRSIIDHEQVHSASQLVHGVEDWWTNYLLSAEFRLEEEIPAHRQEYLTVIASGSRKQRRMALREIAHKLAAPIYGNLVSVHEAKRLIGRGDADL